jgi:hypothetical protein
MCDICYDTQDGAQRQVATMKFPAKKILEILKSNAAQLERRKGSGNFLNQLRTIAWIQPRGQEASIWISAKFGEAIFT